MPTPTFKPGTGYIPARRKDTDPTIDVTKYAGAALPVAPDMSLIPVLMQNQLEFCVEHAITTYVMWLHYKATGQVVLLSPRSLVINTIRMMGASYAPGGGTDLFTALQAAVTYGIAEDSVLTNDTTLTEAEYANLALLTDAVNQSALKYRVDPKGYYFLSGVSDASIRQALSQYSLLLYGVDINDSWWTPSWNYPGMFPITPPSASNPSTSRHLICGYYDPTLDKFRNEWSTAWGQGGDGWFNVGEIPYIYEAAVITSLFQSPVIEQADQIVSTIDQLKQVENPSNTGLIASIISQLWQKFATLFASSQVAGASPIVQTNGMAYSQIASIIGAVLAVLIGAGGIFLGWFNADAGLGLVFAGLSLLGIHANLPTTSA